MKKTTGLILNGRMVKSFLVLAAVALLTVMTGCATHSYQGGADIDGYNPETGYPLVGSTGIPRI